LQQFKWIESGHPKIREVFQTLFNDDDIISLGIGGGGGGGKTFTGSAWAWTECCRYSNFAHAFCKTDLKNARRTILQTYGEFCRKFNIHEAWRGNYDRFYDAIVFPNGSKIYFIDLKHYPVKFPLADNLGGYLLNSAVVDDSPDVKKVVIEKLYTRINRNIIYKSDGTLYKGKILETFNPHKGRVKSLFYNPYKKKTETKERRFIPMIVTDWLKHKDYFLRTSNIHPEDEGTWYADYIRTLLTQSYETQQRLLYGDFDYDDRPQAMFSYQAVTNAFERSAKTVPNWRLLSIDPAYTGKDSMVMTIFRGFDHIEYIIQTDDKLEPHEVEARVREVMEKFNIPASNVVFDADGTGRHLTAITGTKRFHGGAAPVVKKSDKEKNEKQKQYDNLRTQCYYTLAEDFKNGIITSSEQPKRYLEEVKQDLSIWEKTKIDDDKKFFMNSKALAKAGNGGKSPDFSDSLMMSRWLKMLFSSKLSKWKPASA